MKVQTKITLKSFILKFRKLWRKHEYRESLKNRGDVDDFFLGSTLPDTSISF